MTVASLCEQATLDLSAGRVDEVESRCRQILALDQNHCGALHLLGLAMQNQNRLEEAEELLGRCVRTQPTSVEHRNNWGAILGRLGRLEESAEELLRVTQLVPEFAAGHRNLGITLVRQGMLPEAIAALRHSIKLAPHDAAAHMNLGRALLFAGDFAAGWSEMEWRLIQEEPWWRILTVPLWDGRCSLFGKTILVHAEQGLGDTLQFCRFVEPLNEAGARVLLMVQPPLVSLLGSIHGVEAVLPLGLPVSKQFDFHIPLMSLPLVLGTRLENIPQRIPYLHASVNRIQYWREQLGKLGRNFKIGIAWQGSTTYYSDRHRSIPLSYFEPLAKLQGVQLISLQKGYGTEQLAGFTKIDAVVDLKLDPGWDAFLDTAAVMSGLDLVITSDTAIAHLAGSLGVPVWVALCATPDWRWMADGSNSPWYPTMRLFRQKTLGDWGQVFDELTANLRRSVEGRPSAISLASSPKTVSEKDFSATIRIGPGELLDRLSILRLKAKRIKDETKRAHAAKELASLETIANCILPDWPLIDTQAAALMAVNDRLWHVEDYLRNHEATDDFGKTYIELSRSVCRLNDWRSSLKGKIDQVLGWENSEAKIYAVSSNRKPAKAEYSAQVQIMTVADAIKAMEAQDLNSAKVIAEKILVHEPDNAKAMQVLGLVAYEQDQLELALEWMHKSIAIGPNVPAFHNNLGEALRKTNRLEESLLSYETALHLKEDYSDAHYNMGISLRFLGRVKEALVCNQRAAELSPNDPEIRLNLSITYFLIGDWLNGFKEYEWRWRAKSFGTPRRTFAKPRWRGEDLHGKTLLIHAEQGFGDSIQFCRYIPLLVERGAHVTVEVQPEVKELLSCLPAKVISRGEELASYDYQCPMLSLPLEFGTTINTVPSPIAYLKVDPDRIARWACQLQEPGATGKKVGLVWAGRPTHKNDRNRSLLLRQLLPLGSIPGIRWISLQQGDAARQADAFTAQECDGMRIEHSPKFSDFSDTAALLMNLDLLITVDTSVAHLAGALGKRVWMLNPFVCDWRWMPGHEDTAWYPTMQIFPQFKTGDWSSAIECIARALRELA